MKLQVSSFPEFMQKHRDKTYVKYLLAKVTILEAVQRARIKAKASLERLGMAELLQKHSMWDALQKSDSTPNEEDEKENEDENGKEFVMPDGKIDLTSSLIQEIYSAELPSVAADIINICKDKQVENSIKEKVQSLQDSLKLKRVLSSSITPFTDNEQLLSTTVTSNCSPFVKVQRDDHAFYIRKTTAVWLFQESEQCFF